MIKPRRSLALLIAVLVAAWGDRYLILEWIAPWPKWWKIVSAILVGLLVTLTIIWSTGMEWILFYILDIPCVLPSL